MEQQKKQLNTKKDHFSVDEVENKIRNKKLNALFIMIHYQIAINLCGVFFVGYCHETIDILSKIKFRFDDNYRLIYQLKLVFPHDSIHE